MKKFFRRALTALLIVATLLTATIAHAEIKTYEGLGEYFLLEDDSPKEIKDKAKLYAERNALEQAGVLIKSYSRTKNFELVDDEIISITGGILKIVDTVYELIPLNDKTGIAKYRAKVIAQIDTSNIDAAFEKWFGRDKKERSELAKQNEELQRIIDEQNRRIAYLEAKINSGVDKQNFREEFASVDKETAYAQKLNEAEKARKDGNFEDVLRIYSEALELKPDSAEAYTNRGRAYDWLSQSDKAFQDYNKAIQLDPTFAQAYNLRASIYFGMKNYDAAIQDLSKAIELNPKNDGAYWGRGSAYMDLRNYDSAVCDFAKCLEIDPADSMNTYDTSLSLVYFRAKSEQSIDALTELLKVKPDYVEGYLYRCRIYINRGNYGAAIKDCDKAIQLQPN